MSSYYQSVISWMKYFHHIWGKKKEKKRSLGRKNFIGKTADIYKCTATWTTEEKSLLAERSQARHPTTIRARQKAAEYTESNIFHYCKQTDKKEIFYSGHFRWTTVFWFPAHHKSAFQSALRTLPPRHSGRRENRQDSVNAKQFSYILLAQAHLQWSNLRILLALINPSIRLVVFHQSKQQWSQ